MASFVKRGAYQFQALIRRKGYPTQTKTFETLREAKAWAHIIESEMVRGVFTDRAEAESTTLGEALERYKREKTSNKRSPKQEEKRITAWRKHPLSKRSLASLRSQDFATYRDERKKLSVGGNTIRLELAVISHLFTIARKEWNIPVENPIRNVAMPELPEARSRRLMGDEEKRLLDTCRKSRKRIWLVAAVELAIETGMREGELLTVEWQQLNLSQRTALLERTKNGSKRTVPLSAKAIAILESLPRSINGRVLGGLSGVDALSHLFGGICKTAKIPDLHFYDLRHEAASRLAPFMPVQTLAKVMGWKTLQMAMRYYNPSDTELVQAIDQATRHMKKANNPACREFQAKLT